MRKIVQTGLPTVAAPIEWAVIGDNTLYTVQIPIRPDGMIESGDIVAQTKLVFANLKQTLEAARSSLDDVTQVQIFLAEKEDFQAVNAVYRTIFSPPYPNRSTVVAGLVLKGSMIEIVVHAFLKNRTT